MPTYLQTVTGVETVEKLGVILPHEHLFTDLRGPQTPGYAQGDPQAVHAVVGPFLKEAEAAGVTALVECSTGGVGRNIHILQYLASRTNIKIIAPTGVYREAYIPTALQNVSTQALAEMWIGEIEDGIEGSEVRAGFIKIAMSDDGPTPREVRNLQAAAKASLATGAAVASHTIGGALAMEEMDILEAAGMPLNRFVWVHANAEADVSFHLQAARRGAYVEFDGLGSSYASLEEHANFTLNLVQAGFIRQVLLSHDAGWYQPGSPTGAPDGGYRGYTALIEQFMPLLKARGLTDDDIRWLVHTNPAQAFGLKV